MDGDRLLAGGDVEESIFAILCKLRDEREAVALILSRIGRLTVPRQREAVAGLLILSGLRGLKALVKEEITRMPVSIDIHENEFLEEIYQEGGESVGRQMLIEFLEQKFGTLPPKIREQVLAADLNLIRNWTRRFGSSATLDQIFE